jgi:hypothetical protein
MIWYPSVDEQQVNIVGHLISYVYNKKLSKHILHA